MSRSYHCLILAVIIGLSFVMPLGEYAQAATRLGLHVTQEELNIWRARRTDNVNGSNGVTYQNIYNNRIKTSADSFKGSPTDGLWNPTLLNSCVPDNQTVAPGRTNGVKVMASAFVFLLSGDTTYAAPVLANLLTQAGRASTNFSNSTMWCVTNSDANAIEIPGWITRLLFAYDYLRAGGYSISTANRQTIETWFNNAATYWLAKTDLQIHDNVFSGRPTDYTCHNNCPSSAIGTTYYGGYTVNWFHNAWSNRIANAITLVGAVANIPNPTITINPNLTTHAKWFFQEAIKYSIFPDGSTHELFRWADGGGSASAWTHATFQYGPLVSVADHFARAGDSSLYDFASSTGLYGTGGTVKSIESVVLRMARMQNGTVTVYGSATATSDPSLILNGNSEGGHTEDWIGMVSNLYFRDNEVHRAMARTVTPNSGCGGANCYGGPWGVYLDLPFMFGQMEGQVNPYGGSASAIQPPTSSGVTVDSTYSGYTTAAIDDGVINATGGMATTWASADDSATADHWINIALPSAQQINNVTIYWAYNNYQQKYMTSQRVDVQYWNGSSYVTAATMTYPGSDVPSTTLSFPSVTTSQIRFYQPANQGNPTYSTVFWITEVDYSYKSPPTAPTILQVTVTP